MGIDLLDLYDDEVEDDYEIIKAPFGWAGGKTKSVKNIIEVLPYTETYVEPFGGSGAVLLARRPSTLEIFNDRYSGIVDFYRCLQGNLDELVDRLELSTYSREEWLRAKGTWTQSSDPVERAALWYMMIDYSFGCLGRNFGRSKGTRIAGRIQRKLKRFPQIHKRLQHVCLENCDWACMFRDYSYPEATIYCDPPYLGTDQQMYPGPNWTEDDQKRLLAAIFSHPGFVALSSYRNKLNDDMPWDEVHEWDAFVSVQGDHGKDDAKRTNAKEILYIKEID